MVELYDGLKGKPAFANSFELLAFPCNQFGAQEPGSPQEIAGVTARYGVKFPMMAKVDVNGGGAHPVFKLMKGDGGNIQWNFATKFLVACGKSECEARRFDGSPPPLALKGAIQEMVEGLGHKSDEL